MTTSNATLTIALVGNPNTGKSTVFTALSGVHQRVGNYPGVTVEKRLGSFRCQDREVTLVDLPGTYSLAPRSPDEMVTVDVLLGRRSDTARPDAILCILDAAHLERNLYLLCQVLELGLPVVAALNMTDVAESHGISIDQARLQERLGVTLVATQAHRGVGIDELRRALTCPLTQSNSALHVLPPAFQEESRRLGELLENQIGKRVAPYLVDRLLLDTTGYMERALLPLSTGTQTNGALRFELLESRRRLAAAGLPVPGIEAVSRYAWVSRILNGVIEKKTSSREVTFSDRLDHVLTHRVWGSLTFILLMALMFQSVFTWAGPAMDVIEGGLSSLGEWVGSRLPEGALRSLLVQGVIAGVGGVLVFLPQIAILFFFIAMLEDCGYMARAAYLMDKLMSRIGLSGKSFIPLLSSFACAIPGIMATRVIENPRDRLVTVLIAPLMSCSARLPVYTLLIAAFVPPTAFLGGWIGLQGLTMLAMYAVGILAAILVATALRRTILPGGVSPFIMELPSYKAPSPKMVLYRMVERSWEFVRRAGTLILAVTIVVWAAAYFPRDEEAVEGPHRGRLAELEAQRTSTTATDEQRDAASAEIRAIENQIAGDYLRASWLGRAGRWIEPAVRPLGWDWRIGSAAIASFPAREVVVGTMGVIFNLGEEAEEAPLQDNLKSATWAGTDRPLFTLPTALSLMVFFSLCAQCAATLAVMRKETNGWKWPVFTFVYMTTLAYVAACATFQIGSRFL